MKLISSSSLLLLSVILGLYNRVASHPPSYQRWNDKAFEAAENAEEAEEIAEEAEDLAEDAYLDSKYADEHSESKYVKMRAEEAEREYKQVIANENSAEEAAESARRNAEMGDTKDAIRYQKKAIDSAEKAVDNAGDALWNSVEAIDAAV